MRSMFAISRVLPLPQACAPCLPSLVSCRCHKHARSRVLPLPHARHVCHLSCLAAATSVVVQKDTPAVKLVVRLQNCILLPVLAAVQALLSQDLVFKNSTDMHMFFGLYPKQNCFTKNKNYCNASGDELLLVDYFMFLNGYIHEIMLI